VKRSGGASMEVVPSEHKKSGQALRRQKLVPRINISFLNVVVKALCYKPKGRGFDT
jgi:hypothetical protein